MGGRNTKLKTQDKNVNKNVNSLKSKYAKGEVYYLKEKVENLKENVEGGTARVLLFLSFRSKSELGQQNLRSKFPSNSKIKIVVSLSSINNNSYFSEVGTTEDIDVESGKFNFDTSFAMNYYFERNQHLKFKIIQDRKEVEEFNVVLGKIMGSRKQTHEEKLKHHFGISSNYDNQDPLYLSIAAVAEKETTKNNMINFKINAFFNNNDEYFFILSNNIRKDQVQRVYKSNEYRAFQFEAHIRNMNINDICLGEKTMPITFEFYSEIRGHLSTINVSLDSLNSGASFELLGLGKNEVLGNCRITYEIYEKLRFIDYLQKGLQVSLFVGVDYTGSNRDPRDRMSLHYIQGTEPNCYEQAIRTCGGIVAYYDYDQRFPVFGFGAILNNSSQVSHCFNVNFNPNDPFVDGLDGIIAAYRNSLYNLRLDGPTYFTPLIKNMIDVVKNEISSSTSNVYYILLILTDGIIHDMDSTRDVICEAASLPISIIIIGIGNSDFSNMVELDGDSEPIVDKFGKKIERDIVQFVIYEKYKMNPQELAAEVLYEVPGQVEKYYSLHKFKN